VPEPSPFPEDSVGQTVFYPHCGRNFLASSTTDAPPAGMKP